MYDVRCYLRFARGPGDPVGILAILRDLWHKPRIRVWGSVCSATGGDIRLWHWRWGPVIWGFELVKAGTSKAWIVDPWPPPPPARDVSRG